jgi:hypothetical protein
VEGRVEGRDFEPVRDSLLGVTPWRGRFEAWHEPPALRTSLPEGTRLRVSWYHAALARRNQATACPADSGTLERLRDEARRVRELFAAGAHLMMIDEVRALYGDESCRRAGRTPGEVLARSARECAALLEGSTVLVWSDMFDPHHNARKGYDLVQGDLAGSWRGLDTSVVIVNWNGDRPRESLRFFAGRGHRQVIAGFYDHDVEALRGWFRAARGVPGIVAVMYTTWQGDYGQLERFAEIVREEAPGPR